MLLCNEEDKTKIAEECKEAKSYCQYGENCFSYGRCG